MGLDMCEAIKWVVAKAPNVDCDVNRLASFLTANNVWVWRSLGNAFLCIGEEFEIFHSREKSLKICEALRTESPKDWKASCKKGLCVKGL